MLYSLPSGRVINITVEQFLSMTDDDIQFMVANNHGESINSPWYGSAVHYDKTLSKRTDIDKSIDFAEEYDEAQQHILPEEGFFDELSENQDENTESE